MVPDNYPSFKELPLDKTGPHGNAWGLWGPDDQLGTLNLLTDDVVARAAKENIVNGQRVSLKLLSSMLMMMSESQWSFNSQCSSQWDGFRHYAYQNEALYYMGRTAKEFSESPIPNGIQHVSRKGISGRAIFIDWYAWAQKHELDVDAFTSYEVPFSSLIEALNEQGLSKDIFRPSDNVVIRFGYLSQYESMSSEKRESLDNHYKTNKPDNIGIKPSRDLLEFLWDNKIAAICGDTRSLEVWPCKDEKWHMHEWLLAGWGMPIGELFYLEDVSQLCSSLGRYIFFLSSSPMNVTLH
ncbi:hypothetical protein CSUB01_12167 [Colletotrichum sublineola]|uniref:Uncharacterized protein n=1 Tax=Colletotrichum sublineola TaxID=1173701 RepID=A0A066XTL7_COLSU|nr:hypothetical protein CSUB01_12167 [Colletotrichum sublineola]